MRHRKKTVKLQRRKDHREALLSNLCKSLIEHRRIKTTLAKAKALRPVAEKLCTLGKKAITAKGKDARQTSAMGVHYRRMAYRTLQNETLVKKLVDEIATASLDRVGGYTRITKLGQRMSDSAPMAFIEWVDAFVPKVKEPAAEEAAESDKDEAAEAKPKKKAAKAAKGEKAEKAEKAAKPAKEAKPKKSKKED
jgi:large subunit ribosomal protein L17